MKRDYKLFLKDIFESCAVLLDEDDWRAIQETLYLLSIPGMRDSIKEGLEISLNECSEELGW